MAPLSSSVMAHRLDRRVRRAFRMLRSVWQRYRDADLSIMAAAVAYNAFLALVPTAIAVLTAAASIGRNEEALERVERTLELLAPEAVVTYVTDLLRDLNQRVGGQQGWLILVSVAFALWLGARGVVALQKALARVQGMEEDRPGLQVRLIGVGLTVGGGAALLLTSSLLVAGRRAVQFLTELTGLEFLETLWLWVRIPLSTVGVFLFLLAFYRWGPPRPLPKSWLAALLATGGVLLASLGFGLYLTQAGELGATFGALGAVAAALVWLYLGAFVILLGAVVVAYAEGQRAHRASLPGRERVRPARR
ncbi:MAG: YihY/virulence factor BrkB family protein [Acidimicrobiia bacterium]